MAVDYTLNPSTLRAVRQAGSSEAMAHLQKAKFAEGIGNVVTGIGEQIQEKKVEKETAIENWDTGFDAMGDRGSWASGELYDQFQDMEAGYRDEYLEAVRKGDKKAQARMLKDQATRSSGLKGWKETMESAKKINDGVGWSNTFKGDPESLAIMNALTTLDGKTASARISEDGEMVFDIKVKGKTITKTRREIDDMIAKGVKPVQQELEFMNGLLSYEEKGASGKPFNFKVTKRNNELNMQDEEIPALMREDFGGGGSFSEHIKKHPDMIAQFADVIGNGDGTVTAEEEAALNSLIDSDMGKIIDAMEANPTVAKSYVAEWKTMQEQTAWQNGKGQLDAAQGLKTFTALTKEQKENLSADQLAKLLGI